MNYHIDVNPQFSAQLTEAARDRGVDPVKLLESLVAEYLPPVVFASGNGGQHLISQTPQERIRALDTLAEKYANKPVLPDSAFDRENIYEDRP